MYTLLCWKVITNDGRVHPLHTRKGGGHIAKASIIVLAVHILYNDCITEVRGGKGNDLMKKIAIIGAGPGGLAAAMILSSHGYDIHVYEKQKAVGGRNGHFTIGDYTFDIGPTFLSMPQIMEEIFSMSGRNVYEYMDMKELSPMYELQFDGKRVPMYRDREKNAESHR
ncbi:NAD(P)-binding Rossmann-like domain-containing protein [Halobacillus dabanensis]|uniref:NAD(P)-binding Rossmann-like domain-containing protein n=1 Tax=Halobacillus dabanensis TaxID=240302 RepID=A0A1I3V5F6_HALDA|nr:NAD(P)-binding Rossmann-like domain-containing protein [Halobacillus dabanensis]